MTKVDSFFTDLLKEPTNQLIDKAILANMIPIGYTCSYVPEVLLGVGNLLPLRVRSPGIQGTEIAEIYLSNVTCSYIRSMLEYALDDRFEFLRGWVFASSCDQMCRLFDNLKAQVMPEFIEILDVPRRMSDASLAKYTRELDKLCKQLTSTFAVKFDDEALLKAIENHNTFMSLLSTIGDARKNTCPPISGYEFHTILSASLIAPRQFITDRIKKIADSLLTREKITNFRARLLVVGGQLDDPEYFKVIESMK